MKKYFNWLRDSLGGALSKQGQTNQAASHKKKIFIIVLQETHCTIADKLAIPILSQAGLVLSRKHGLATFVHERLEWSHVNQSPEQSGTEWLHVDVGYKIIKVYKPPR